MTPTKLMSENEAGKESAFAKKLAECITSLRAHTGAMSDFCPEIIKLHQGDTCQNHAICMDTFVQVSENDGYKSRMQW